MMEIILIESQVNYAFDEHSSPSASVSPQSSKKRFQHVLFSERFHTSNDHRAVRARPRQQHVAAVFGSVAKGMRVRGSNQTNASFVIKVNSHGEMNGPPVASVSSSLVIILEPWLLGSARRQG